MLGLQGIWGLARNGDRREDRRPAEVDDSGRPELGVDHRGPVQEGRVPRIEGFAGQPVARGRQTRMMTHQYPPRPERGCHHAEAAHLIISKAASWQQIRLIESNEDINSLAPGTVKLAIGILRKEGIGRGNILGPIHVSYRVHTEEPGDPALSVDLPVAGVVGGLLQLLLLAGKLDALDTELPLEVELVSRLVRHQR